jgi:creatinine amidohydrolase/Fe(II)-dependent formamide hydrolase-like protein
MQEADRTVHDGRMGKAARATAERYGFDAMAAQLARLYESLK